MERLLSALKARTDTIDTTELENLVCYREMFDKNHETSILIGRLPVTREELERKVEVIDCWFDEGIDDFITVFEWKTIG